MCADAQGGQKRMLCLLQLELGGCELPDGSWEPNSAPPQEKAASALNPRTKTVSPYKKELLTHQYSWSRGVDDM